MRMFTTALLGTPDSLEDPSNNINGTILGIALSPPNVRDDVVYWYSIQ